jgi:hypothetical protein
VGVVVRVEERLHILEAAAACFRIEEPYHRLAGHSEIEQFKRPTHDDGGNEVGAHEYQVRFRAYAVHSYRPSLR